MAVLPNSSRCFDRLHSAHSADRGGFFTQVPFRLLPDSTGKEVFTTHSHTASLNHIYLSDKNGLYCYGVCILQMRINDPCIS